MKKTLPYSLSRDYQSYRDSLDARHRRLLEELERKAGYRQSAGIGWLLLGAFLLGFLLFL